MEAMLGAHTHIALGNELHVKLVDLIDAETAPVGE